MIFDFSFSYLSFKATYVFATMIAESYWKKKGSEVNCNTALEAINRDKRIFI